MRLLERLSGDDWRVCVAAAGPGTGKSTLAGQWLEGADGAWLSLDEGIDSCERFWVYVAAALQRARPGAFDATEELAIRSGTDSATFVTQLLDEAAALTRPLALVLEDLHVLHDRSVLASLACVIEGLPRQLRILITSRSDPALPIARWRARSWLLDIRQRDLAFDLAETTDLLAALGEHRMTPDEVVDLQVRTEGWVAALILTALAMRDGGDAPVTRALTGSNRMIAELLAGEVIDRQSDGVRDLMLCSSIADEFDADLCNVLTGRTDSQSRFEALERDTHFVVTVDGERPTYRYHRLLLDLLRAELERQSPGRAIDLHRIAARALEARGDLVSAVGHNLACGETDRAFELVFDPGFAWCEHDHLAGAATSIGLFPVDYLGDSIPRMLKCAFALALCCRWDEAHAWLHRAEKALDADPSAREEDVALLDVLRLYLFLSEGADEAGVECGQRVLGRIDRGLELGAAGEQVRPNLASAYLLIDDPETADKTMRGPVPAGGNTTMVLEGGVRARVALRQGHLRAAAEHGERALAAATAFDVAASFVSLEAHIAVLGVLTDRDDLVGARQQMELLEEALAGHPALAYRVIGRLDEVRIAAVSGLDGAFSVVDGLRAALHGHDRPALCAFVDATEARLRLEAGDIGAAEALAGRLRFGSPIRHLLDARVHVARGCAAEARQELDQAHLTTVRDTLNAELLRVRACIVSGEDPERHLARVVELAAPEHLVRVVLEEDDVVVRLVRTTAERLGVLDAESFARALGSPPRHRHSANATITFTEREQAVLRFLPSRLTNQEIGAECFMSVNTVKAHLKNLYAKLGVSSRSAAIERARLLGELT
jgi:LuxR family transcriptional regulator, maltose regulon positive regulatory protein